MFIDLLVAKSVEPTGKSTSRCRIAANDLNIWRIILTKIGPARVE